MLHFQWFSAILILTNRAIGGPWKALLAFPAPSQNRGRFSMKLIKANIAKVEADLSAMMALVEMRSLGELHHPRSRRDLFIARNNSLEAANVL